MRSKIPAARLAQSIHKRLVKWPLFDLRCSIRCSATGDHLSASYGNRWAEHFDIEIIDKTFYINGIGIDREHRGKGQGAALYELLEQVARDMDCDRIVMSASGKTPSGEDRGDWLRRKFGYVKTGGISVVKAL